MNYCYGPVPSRRLGSSLGIDIIPSKRCSFNCCYCQVGKTLQKTSRRFSYVDCEKLKKELIQIIKRKPVIDCITLAGSGEPTLHKNLDRIISVVRKVTKRRYPICLITNGSLLYRKTVRDEIKDVDIIMPSLDAANEKTFLKINSPCEGITLDKVLKGLIALRREFKKEIWLEIMLVGGVNDTVGEARAFKVLVDNIKPDKLQINLPVRPSWKKVSLPDLKKVNLLKNIIDPKARIIVSSAGMKSSLQTFNLKKEIIMFLKRRPATLADLEKTFSESKNKINSSLRQLERDLIITAKFSNNKKYFILNDS
ncbi:MAG: radical SAM protein [Candidatus Omnitrophica bacterium]|nr:radical SAM protein [Candidatus Omnitrophota bacterium]